MRYLQYKNGSKNPGYVKFLSQAIDPTLPFLSSGSKGLDYACGPEPALSDLLSKNGITCDNYDATYFPLPLNATYDFIFATECLEHFFLPVKELQRIKTLLKTGGILTIMTERWRTPETFRSWGFAKAPANVSFYHNATFDYICSKFGFTMLHTDNHRVAVLKKEPVATETMNEPVEQPEENMQPAQ